MYQKENLEAKVGVKFSKFKNIADGSAWFPNSLCASVCMCVFVKSS